MYIIPLIQQRLFQGSYPSNTDELNTYIQQYNINVIVDLTEFSNIYKSEVINADNIEFIKFPIMDYYIPSDNTKFHKLIEKLYNLYKEDKNIFIHCQGGRGRSSIVTCCLYGKINNIKSGSETINIISNILHFSIPETYQQKEYVRFYFKNYIRRNYIEEEEKEEELISS